MNAMQTAYSIAICDDGVSPHNSDKCVFAKRGTEPFENLAKGYVINVNRHSCNVACLKQWWIGDPERIRRMTFNCQVQSAADYTGGFIYQACGNPQGLHMSLEVNNNRRSASAKCGWIYNDAKQDMPSLWIQTKLSMDAYMCSYM